MDRAKRASADVELNPRPRPDYVTLPDYSRLDDRPRAFSKVTRTEYGWHSLSDNVTSGGLSGHL